MNALRKWMKYKWRRVSDADLLESYRVTFSHEHGSRVLQHLLDNIYFKVYEGINAEAALVHNARRGVIQEILENIDMAEYPEKYVTRIEESVDGLAG